MRPQDGRMGKAKTQRGPAVRFHQVTRRYASNYAIAGIDLEVDCGSFVALVGASGSGKSTLLKTVNRLIAPTSGHVSIDGTDIHRTDIHQLRRSIGYVIQGTGLFPHLDVAANIEMGSAYSGRARQRTARG